MNGQQWSHKGPIDILDNGIIYITTAGCIKLVVCSQVEWIEADGDYARLHTAHHSYLARITLKTLEQHWSKYGFVRIHRSHLVSFPQVTNVWMGASGYHVRVGSGSSAVNLPVSRRQVKEFKKQWLCECYRRATNIPQNRPSIWPL